jgi:muconate cycloisomerase
MGSSPGGEIVSITATEVVVPAHPGAICTPGRDKPLHKLPHAGQDAWTVQFDELPKLVLQLRLRDGTVGLGELYRDHDWVTVEAMARQLLGREIDSLTLQRLPLAAVREYDGFEVALYDAYARRHGMRVVDLLGGPVRTSIRASAWSGQREAEDLAATARRFGELGYDCLKLKCDAGDDVVRWCQLVAEAAPGMDVVLDPNERFGSLATVRKLLPGLVEAGNVLLLEDPIPQWQLDDWRLLRASSALPIARHVALGYPSLGIRPSDVVTAIAAGAVDGFNLSAGIAAYSRLDHVAATAQLPTFHGSEVDLGILEAAYVHTACAAQSTTWPSDVFSRLIRSHDLLAEPLRVDPPNIQLPEGPGLGVELDPEALSRFRQHEQRYEA